VASDDAFCPNHLESLAKTILFDAAEVVSIQKRILMKKDNDQRYLTLGLVQMSMTKDRQENLAKASGMIEEAASKGANLVCLPELFASTYFPQEENSDEKPEKIPGPTSEFLSNLAKRNHIVLVAGSIFEKDGKKKYNTSVIFDQDGKMLRKYRKVHVPCDEAFYEQDYFSSGNSYLVVRSLHSRIGVLICFDQWYPEPARIIKLMGADILFYPTAIGTVRGIEQTEGNWREAWEAVQRGHAISNSMIVATVNRVGVEKEMNFWGGSFVYDQFGKLLARAGDKEEVLVVECDPTLGKQIEGGWGFLRNRKPDTYSRLSKKRRG
jgi:predicted amidohydrolase